MFTKDDIWASNGHPKTSSLFTETCRYDDTPIMTLNGGNTNLPCLRELFVPLVVRDPTEATFAEAVFDDLRYWLKLQEAPWIQPYLKEWRAIADKKRKQIAFQALLTEIETQGRSAATCARYLIEEPWKGSKPSTKKQVRKTTEEAITPFAEDLDRLKRDGLLQ